MRPEPHHQPEQPRRPMVLIAMPLQLVRLLYLTLGICMVMVALQAAVIWSMARHLGWL